MPDILLVRPAAQAVADMQVCEAAGWRGIPFPVMKIEPDKQALSVLAEQYGQADAVFWASPTAVQAGMGVLDSASLRFQLNIAVGRGTADALEKAGCGRVYAPAQGNDSESVLQIPVWQMLPNDARILIVRGRNGRGLLAESLKQRGMQVRFAEIYERVEQQPDWQVFSDMKPDAVWIGSAESVAILFAQMPAGLVQKAKSLLYFTHHPRIAAALRQRGAGRVKLIERFDVPTLNRYTEQTDER